MKFEEYEDWAKQVDEEVSFFKEDTLCLWVTWTELNFLYKLLIMKNWIGTKCVAMSLSQLYKYNRYNLKWVLGGATSQRWILSKDEEPVLTKNLLHLF